MRLEEKGVALNIPDNLKWEKIDEMGFYRNISHLGLKAVDFVFYGRERLVFLEIKNFKPNLEDIRDENLRKEKRREIIKGFSPEKINIQLANKLVSSIYIIFGKKLRKPKKIIFCALLILPQDLECYQPFINTSLGNLKTEDENLLKVSVLVLNNVELVERRIINSLLLPDKGKRRRG
ncbi:hypothetical protein JCM12298_08900 [Desulfothermus naphthae]